MRELGPAIDGALRREEVGIETVDALERLRTVLAFCGKRLASADPAIIQPAPLEGIATALQAASSEVQAFAGDGDTGHVTNANAHADTALGHVSQVSIPLTLPETEALREAIISFRESVLRSSEQTRASLSALRTETES
jgi:hypothetical protein